MQPGLGEKIEMAISNSRREQMTTKILDAKLLVPTKFQPKFSRHFLLEIEGIDSFLVKKIEFAPYKRPSSSWHQTDHEKLLEMTASKHFTVHLHDAIEPSARMQVQGLLNVFAPKKATISFLDPIGTVVEQEAYTGLQVEKIEYDSLDYASSGPLEIRVTFGYSSMTSAK